MPFYYYYGNLYRKLQQQCSITIGWQLLCMRKNLIVFWLIDIPERYCDERSDWTLLLTPTDDVQFACIVNYCWNTADDLMIPIMPVLMPL